MKKIFAFIICFTVACATDIDSDVEEYVEEEYVEPEEEFVTSSIPTSSSSSTIPSNPDPIEECNQMFMDVRLCTKPKAYYVPRDLPYPSPHNIENDNNY